MFTLIVCDFFLKQFASIRSVGTPLTVYDPVYGKRFKKNFSTIRIAPEFNIELTTNEHGYRDISYASLPDKPILFLGDSFTMGYGVSDEETFPSLVRKALDEKYGKHALSVINAGIGDNGNGRWLKFLQLEGKKYNPRFIVLQICENDFIDNQREDFYRLKNEYDLEELIVPPKSFARKTQDIVDRVPYIPNSYIFGLIRQVRYTMLTEKWLWGEESRDLERNDLLTYRIVEDLVELCRKEKWPLLVVFVGETGREFKHFTSMLDKLDVPSLVTPDAQERPDLFFKIDGHWNRSGHQLAATLIMNKLHEMDTFNIIAK